MKRYPILLTALLFAAAVTVGCSDGLVDPEPAATPAETEVTVSKLRHGHLIDSGTENKGGGNGGKNTGGTSTAPSGDAFIVGTTTLDPYAILDRYSTDFGVEPRRMFKNKVKGFSINTKALTSSQKAALFAALDADSDVAYYEPESRATIGKSSSLEYKSGSQYVPNNLKHIGADVNSVRSGSGLSNVPVDVYIIDSGVVHPDLNVVERIDFTEISGQDLTPTRVLERYALLQRYALLERFEYSTGTANDAIGHGTHVAGTLAAIDDTDHLVGVAPGALIHDFRVLDDNGNGDFAAVIEALEIITARKEANPLVPIVVNLSLGANVGTSDYNALDEMVEDAVRAGVVVVVAAGNDGIDVANVSPAHVSGAFTVAAAEFSRNKFGALSTSNLGAGIDIWAPGKNIESLLPDDPNYMNRLSGTSMAAPHVSGAIAIYLMTNPTAKPAHIKTYLRSITGKKLFKAPTRTTDLVIDVSQL